MTSSEFKVDSVYPSDRKVIFDTNAYRNFTEDHLRNSNDFFSTIDRLKECEKKRSIIPSSNIITIMELYKHLKEDDNALLTCKKAIIFSFLRSYVNDSFNHQPIPEIEIADKIFETYADNDMQLNASFINGHVNFCTEDPNPQSKTNEEFIRKTTQQLENYQQTFFEAIIKNVQQLFPSFDAASKRFSKKESNLFKRKFGKKRKKMYRDLGTSLFNSFRSRLGIEGEILNREELIAQLIIHYQPALHYTL